jgi:peptidylprolyl isomerase
MKSMFQFIAVAVCAAALAACGGGPKDTTTVVIPPQPDYKLTETLVGSGALVAEAGDSVVVRYNGFLYDAAQAAAGGRGAKVLSSTDVGGTLTFTVGVGSRAGNGVVTTGWDQALLGMRAGGTRTAILPTNLAYNNTAAIPANTVNGVTYPAIPAYAPLVFDFEMVSVTKAVVIPSVPPPSVTTITEVLIGTGATAANGQTVTVRYTGWLYDGTRDNRKGAVQFDSNVTSTDPLTVVVGATTGSNTVIPGFSTGIVGMKVGGKRTVIIPPDQGYGSTATSTIPANSTLVFDIELISIK